MKIALLGDIAFYGRFSLKENDSILNYFEQVANFLRGFDFVIGNLETPFANGSETFGFKSAYIKAHPSDVRLLKYLNVNVVNLANNHIFDFGKDAYKLTKQLLLKNNISFFGVEDQQILIEKSDSKVALQGYCCYSTNPVGLSKKKRLGINELNIPTVIKNLAKNSEAGYYNILSMHCGQEHVNYPNFDHVILARQLALTCPYVFYGHHPHVMQGIEEVNGSVISYSLGNFCFDDLYTSKSEKPLIVQSENNKTSFILTLEFKKNRLLSYKPVPIYASKNSLVLNHPGVLERLEQYSSKLKDDKDIYNSYRESLLHNYIKSRKQLRNLNWYRKRFNIKSVRIILASFLNKRNYQNNVKRYLQE